MRMDTTFQTIGIPLLSKDLIVQADGSGWYKIDLSSYQITIPKEGVIVSVIIYDAGSQYYYRHRNVPGYNYGIGIWETSTPQSEVYEWGYQWKAKQFGIMSNNVVNYTPAVQIIYKIVKGRR